MSRTPSPGRVAQRARDILPVVSDPHTKRLLGILNRKDVLEAYQRRILLSRPEKSQ